MNDDLILKIKNNIDKSIILNEGESIEIINALKLVGAYNQILSDSIWEQLENLK